MFISVTYRDELLVDVVHPNAFFVLQAAFDAYPRMYQNNARPTMCLLGGWASV